MLECQLFFLVGNNFGSSEDSSTIEYTEHGLIFKISLTISYNRRNLTSCYNFNYNAKHCN